jgi:triosephosphate isomerase
MLVGNWKANEISEEQLDRISDLDISSVHPEVELMCAPPHVHLRLVAEKTPLTAVAQEISAHPPGAFTGEVTAEAVRRAGARYVLIGHSERRKFCGESDEVIGRKLRRAISAGLGVILCVGDEFRGDDLPSVLSRQLQPLIDAISDHPEAAFVNFSVAYEPVWAIGTGRGPAAEEVARVLEFIREFLRQKLGNRTSHEIRLLYGGSVSETNARSLGEIGNLDGLLVGAASLDPTRFLAIAREVAPNFRVRTV